MLAAFSLGTSLETRAFSPKRSRSQGWPQSFKSNSSGRSSRYALSNRNSRCILSCILEEGSSSSAESDEMANSSINGRDSTVNAADFSSSESACAACNGRGYTDCSDCEGEGFIEVNEALWRTCERCRGKGAAPCTFCTAGTADPQSIPWLGIDFAEDLPLGTRE